MQRHLDPAARHLSDDVPHDAEGDGGVVRGCGGRAHPGGDRPGALLDTDWWCLGQN